jgi:hypothetical protein
VAESDVLVPQFELAERFDGCERVGDLPDGSQVVVPGDQVDLTVEAGHELPCGVWWVEAEVPKEVHAVVLSDTVVPVLDEGFVHLVDVSEWSTGETDDVRMPQMESKI